MLFDLNKRRDRAGDLTGMDRLLKTFCIIFQIRLSYSIRVCAISLYYKWVAMAIFRLEESAISLASFEGQFEMPNRRSNSSVTTKEAN